MTQTAVFRLIRNSDLTGVSGTGVVADGVLWPDGTVTIRWRGERPSTVVWSTLGDAVAVHGHGCATMFDWSRPTDLVVARLRDLCRSHMDLTESGELTDVEPLWPSAVLAILEDVVP